jgi:excisionase family DNA binding protein
VGQILPTFALSSAATKHLYEEGIRKKQDTLLLFGRSLHVAEGKANNILKTNGLIHTNSVVLRNLNGVQGEASRSTENSMEDRFLTPVEAASYLGGINSRTLTRWAREGYIPAIPIGEGKRRIWRFLGKDLEMWMRARRTGYLPSNSSGSDNTIVSAADAPIGGFVQ